MSYISNPMYPPQKDSPSTFLLGAIIPSDTTINVASVGTLPQTTPYPLTLGYDTATTEIVLVTGFDLGSNSLTVTRLDGAKGWPAGTKVARVFNSDDLRSLQNNIKELDDVLYGQVREMLDILESDFLDLATVVGDEDAGIVKDLADEVIRATGVEASLQTVIDTGLSTLNTGKVNRTELPQILTDISYTASATKLTETINRYNAANQQSTSFTRDIPIASNTTVGVMTPEAYNEVVALRNDVLSLQQQGGRFIGVSFDTKSALDSYIIPSTVNVGDFTYVLDDETKQDSTTRYVYDGTEFIFAFVVEYDPVGLATSSEPGLVKGSSDDGKVSVGLDGTMTVNGMDIQEVVDRGSKVVRTQYERVNTLDMNVEIYAEDGVVGKDTFMSFETEDGDNAYANFKRELMPHGDKFSFPSLSPHSFVIEYPIYSRSALQDDDITIRFPEKGGTLGLTSQDRSAILSTTWTGSAAPYTQNVTVMDMGEYTNATVGLASNATAAQREAARNAMLSVTAQTTNQITITADGEKPVITIPISVILLP